MGEPKAGASPARAGRVLVVEDQAAARFAVCRYLARRGFQVAEATTCQQARQQLKEVAAGAMILDLQLPDGDGLQLLRQLRERSLELPVVLLTGTGTIERAVEAMKLGAVDFLVKPLDLEALAAALDAIFVRSRNEKGAADGGAASDGDGDGGAAVDGEPDPFLGTSAAVRELADRARRLAATDVNVLLLGETGSGKGVLARWLHRNSARRDKPLVELNCAELSRELLQSELFGHLPGSFTGADRRKVGLLEAADGGTVFLDEIGDLDPELQPKLLKVLEEKTFRVVGGVESRTVDVRLIAATHPDLPERVRRGEFRQDLFFRISTFPLLLPSLAQRREDLPQLAAAILADLWRGRPAPPPRLAADTVLALQEHLWPGNVRELRNVLERASVLTGGDVLEPSALWFDPVGTATEPLATIAPTTLAAAEVEAITAALHAEDGHVGRAAKRLGIARSTLYEKIKRYDLSPSSASRTGGPEEGL